MTSLLEATLAAATETGPNPAAAARAFTMWVALVIGGGLFIFVVAVVTVIRRNRRAASQPERKPSDSGDAWSEAGRRAEVEPNPFGPRTESLDDTVTGLDVAPESTRPLDDPFGDSGDEDFGDEPNQDNGPGDDADDDSGGGRPPPTPA